MQKNELRIPSIIQNLKDYFEGRQEVLMAFLFGSWAKNFSHKESDIDIAIYFKPQQGYIELEKEDARYPQEHEIWLDMERLLRQEIDLVVLNRAPARISDSAIRGTPVIIKNRKLYWDFMIRVTMEAEDFREFVEEYWKLKQEIHSK
jgi:predicted nucleotidyltransferase